MDMAHEVAVLQQLDAAGLRRRYAEVFGETTKACHRTWLIKRILWRMQALAEGGLSERAQQRIEELANEADLRMFPPRTFQPVSHEAAPAPMPRLARSAGTLPPGRIITKRYKGEMVQVKVVDDGFEWSGTVYPSLSAVAKAITGSHCNGFLFFRLGKYGAAR